MNRKPSQDVRAVGISLCNLGRALQCSGGPIQQVFAVGIPPVTSFGGARRDEPLDLSLAGCPAAHRVASPSTRTVADALICATSASVPSAHC